MRSKLSAVVVFGLPILLLLVAVVHRLSEVTQPHMAQSQSRLIR